MLVLKRAVGQKIRIGDDIVITLLHGTDGWHKIGIEAPREVAVHREEVWQRIRDEVSSNDQGAAA